MKRKMKFENEVWLEFLIGHNVSLKLFNYFIFFTFATLRQLVTPALLSSANDNERSFTLHDLNFRDSVGLKVSPLHRIDVRCLFGGGSSSCQT